MVKFLKVMVRLMPTPEAMPKGLFQKLARNQAMEKAIEIHEDQGLERH